MSWKNGSLTHEIVGAAKKRSDTLALGRASLKVSAITQPEPSLILFVG